MSTASPEAKIKVRKQPPLLLALVPFICLIAIMLPSVIILGADPQIPLIICTAVTSVIAICFLGRGWQEIEDSMIETNTMAMQANFIIMIVGCLVATWIAGGIVPGMIYYGLKLFSPSVFLALLPVICAIIAVSTGSAWTTAGTMGAAAMGIAAGLGIPPAIAAGAVVTGASFGDKLSPSPTAPIWPPGWRAPSCLTMSATCSTAPFQAFLSQCPSLPLSAAATAPIPWIPLRSTSSSPR